MIYVVDDHRDSGEYLARLLRRVGYDVQLHTCGRDLLQQMDQTPPRLVILDLMMPEMNGIACLKNIRAHPTWSNVPVIMYSADFAFERMQEAKRNGAQEFVVKGTLLWPAFLEIIQKHAGPADHISA